MIFSQFVQGLCCRCSWPYWSAIKPRLWLWLPWLLAKLTIHTQHCLSMIYLTRVHVQQVLHSCRYNDSGELSKRSHSSTVALRSSPCYFPIWYFWLMVKNPSFFSAHLTTSPQANHMALWFSSENYEMENPGALMGCTSVSSRPAQCEMLYEIWMWFSNLYKSCW